MVCMQNVGVLEITERLGTHIMSLNEKMDFE